VSTANSDDIFPGYSTDKEDFIRKSMRRSNQDFVVPDKSVCIGDVKTVFQYRSWLNDEAISSYMQLIGERDPNKVYVFNTYFYSLLS
jgi:Ulp1 family protease